MNVTTKRECAKLSVSQFVCLCCQSVCMSICLLISLSVSLSISLFISQTVSLSVSLHVSLSVSLSVEHVTCLSFCAAFCRSSRQSRYWKQLCADIFPFCRSLIAWVWSFSSFSLNFLYDWFKTEEFSNRKKNKKNFIPTISAHLFSFHLYVNCQTCWSKYRAKLNNYF